MSCGRAIDVPFSPSDIPNLVFHYEADAGACTDASGTVAAVDNDPVQSWVSAPDGALVTQATLANRPTFKTNVLNGLPVLRFDGGDTLSRGGLAATAGGDEGFLLLLWKQSGADFDNAVIYWTATTLYRLYATYGDTIYFDFSDGAGGRLNVAQPAGWDDAWHLTEALRRPDGTQSITVDTVELASGTRT